MNPAMASSVTLGLAFAGGFVSFVSPCVLPLVPTYVTFLAGNTAQDTGGPGGVALSRRQILVPGIAFVMGFSLVFIAFGLSASFLGQFLTALQGPLRKVSGVVVALFGLYMTGLIKLPALDRERRLQAPQAQGGLFNAFLLGVVFSLGWTPCIGPILGSILFMAGQAGNAATGALMLSAYSLGMALPFLVLAVFMSGSRKVLTSLQKYAGGIRIASGVLLMAMGIMLYTGFFTRLAGLFNWGW